MPTDLAKQYRSKAIGYTISLSADPPSAAYLFNMERASDGSPPTDLAMQYLTSKHAKGYTNSLSSDPPSAIHLVSMDRAADGGPPTDFFTCTL